MINPYGSSPIIAMFQGVYDTSKPGNLTVLSAYNITAKVTTTTGPVIVFTLANQGVDDNSLLVQQHQYNTGAPVQVDTDIFIPLAAPNENSFTFDYHTMLTGTFIHVTVFSSFDGVTDTP